MTPMFEANYFVLDLLTQKMSRGSLNDSKRIIEIYPCILKEKIVFVTVRISGDVEKSIDIVHLETGKVEHVVTYEGRVIAMPRLSESGVLIFFSQQQNSQDQPWSIHIFNLSTGVSKEVALTSIQQRDGAYLNPQFPVISRDGNWVAFVGPRQANAEDSLSFYICNTTTDEIDEFRNIAPFFLSTPRISTNNKMCYTSDYITGRIWEIDFYSKSIRVLDSHSEPVVLAGVFPIENSSDVLVYYDVSAGGAVIRKISPDGQVKERIIPNWLTSNIAQVDDSTVIVMEIPKDRDDVDGELRCLYLDFSTPQICDSISLPGFSQIFRQIDYFVINKNSE
jgi:hypothetical protein